MHARLLRVLTEFHGSIPRRWLKRVLGVVGYRSPRAHSTRPSRDRSPTPPPSSPSPTPTLPQLRETAGYEPLERLRALRHLRTRTALGGSSPPPAPYTLHPTPYTLHTTHYTLHTTHYILHTTHYTLHPPLEDVRFALVARRIRRCPPRNGSMSRP